MNHAPSSAALCTPDGVITRVELDTMVQALALQLAAEGTRVLATWLDNGPAWIVADLAAANGGLVHVPLPVFFTPTQVGHALQAAGVDTLLAANGMPIPWPGASVQPIQLAGSALTLHRRDVEPVRLPLHTGKITFTSGTTGTPKGVCLSNTAMQQVAAGLAEALAPLAIERHLCALPLPVLLENIAGVLAPLSQGAACTVLPLEQVGLSGSSRFDPARLQAAVLAHQPHSMILLPQMLRAWTLWLQHTHQRAPASLRMVAVGGAAVGAATLLAARAVGIPAFEGYGLSEGASVQTLNLPGADRPGSAGRPLPHSRVRVNAQGELEIAGSLMTGYLGAPEAVPAWWPTGDLGHIDSDGFVHVMGRSKHVLITSFGRNVSPEWVETTLCSQAGVAQAVVFGDAQPALSAVLWPLTSEVTEAQLQAAVDAANQALPDYARVVRWVRARAAFQPGTGLSTANGRPQRSAIETLHADALFETTVDTTAAVA
ncbi:AMP-binding protein [Hydrogenophaga sp.]|uniref:AMP-binding protein n=1 Tax=Hydrogenophaga sp. TaxID=1904254 RepID=UPI002718A9D9|nr:AMP-binding protein [Hydrogenophaga sp.]MDO8906200.1 AMP-binding protein [Hydrogenophaga sp.]